MARGVNKVILIGNLGADPESRYLPSGNAVANITVATSESWKDKQTGQMQERTEWHRVVFFNRLAEIVGEYLKKGSKIYIEGSLRTRKWQDKEGRDQYTTEIVANEMQMLDSRGGGGGGYSEGAGMGGGQPAAPARQQGGFSDQRGSGGQGFDQRGGASGQNRPAESNPPSFDAFDDDIPF